MKARFSIFAVALGAAALIGGAAWACVPGASITLAPPTGGPGTNVTVTGSTFDSQGSPVNIYWDGTAGQLMGQAQVQPDRTFRFTFAVPGVEDGRSHVVSATQLDRNGLAYNPVNRAFKMSGTRSGNTANQQGAAQPEQPDGVTTQAPATQSAAAAQPAPRAAAAPAQASAPAQPGGAAPGPAVGTQTGPQAPPPAPAAEAQQGAAAQQPAGSQEAFRTPVPAPAPAGAGEAVSSSGGGAPAWLLAPLALLSLGFLGAGTGIFLRERKRTRVRA